MPDELTHRIQQLQEDIEQVELEIAVNSYQGTAIRPESERYWMNKNIRWERILQRLKVELESLMDGTDKLKESPPHGE